MPAKTKAAARKQPTTKYTQADFMRAYESGKRKISLDIDPRIDLTKPIYEQAMKLMARDKAAEERAAKRKRQTKAA